MSEPRGKERRSFARFAFPIGVQVKCQRASAIPFMSKPVEVLLHNLSASGIRFAANEAVKVGDAFKGSITIPESKDRVRFSGKVTWTVKTAPQQRGQKAGSVFGLSFNGMDTGDQAKIESMRKWFTSDRFKTTRRVVRKG